MVLRRDKKRVVSPSGGDRVSEALTPGVGGTDKCLGSEDEDGLASMDLGSVTEVRAGFSGSGLASGVWALSGWPAAEAVTVQGPPTAVLGSRPDTVTVVSTPIPQEAGQGEELPVRESSGWLSSGGPGTYFFSGFGPEALSRSVSEAFSGGISAEPSSDK